MFHISAVELMVACGLGLILVIIPLIVARHNARMEQRLKNIEKRLNKKQ